MKKPKTTPAPAPKTAFDLPDGHHCLGRYGFVEPITFPANCPVKLRVADPEGIYDFALRLGQYQTTDGRTFHLPRPAVLQLNALQVAPGEEIKVTRLRKGKEASRWVVELAHSAEMARAEEEKAQETTPVLDKAQQPRLKREPVKVVAMPKRKKVSPDQGTLFEDYRGTGTYGPRALPAQARPELLPWNVAFREVATFVREGLKELGIEWSDECQKNVVCTVLISEARKGRIGMWERKRK